METRDDSVVDLMQKITPDDVFIQCLPIHFTFSGPSAGVTLFISLVSLLTGAKVAPWVAMTGEIGLRLVTVA